MFKPLLKNTGAYFLINLLSQVAVFILWVVIARVLLPSEIGTYALAIFIVDFFGAFSIFGLDTVLTRFYHSEEKKESILSNSIIIFIFSNIISAGLLFCLSGVISHLIPGLSTILIKNIFLLSTLVFFSALYNFSLVHYSAQKKVKSFGQISILQTILFFIMSLLFLSAGFKILGIFYALLISYSISALLFLFKEFKNISFNLFSIKTVKLILQYGSPMMIYSVFGIFVAYIARIFLDRYVGLSTLGIYSFFLMITLQINGVWATFNRAWTPDIFSKLNKNKEDAINDIKKATFFSGFMYLSFIAIMIFLNKVGFLGLFLKQEYLQNIDIFYILLLGPLFTGIYTACYPLYYYEKKTKLVLLISIILNLFNILLTFILIRSFGQIGAAFSFCILSVLTVFAFIISFKKSMMIPTKIINWSIIIFILMSVAIFLSLKTSSFLLLFIFVILGAFLAYKMGDLKIVDFF
jgi:O-antigen/teichoic acid export membrane protein